MALFTILSDYCELENFIIGHLFYSVIAAAVEHFQQLRSDVLVVIAVAVRSGESHRLLGVCEGVKFIVA